MLILWRSRSRSRSLVRDLLEVHLGRGLSCCFQELVES